MEIAGEETYDTIRDTVADLGLGLVRLEQRRHHVSEIFTADEQADEQPAEQTAEQTDKQADQGERGTADQEAADVPSS